MKIPYMAVPRPQAIPSLGGQRVRYRPITAIRLIGPTTGLIRDGLLDTGADDTVFPEETARLLGIDLGQAEERQHYNVLGHAGFLQYFGSSTRLRSLLTKG